MKKFLSVIIIPLLCLAAKAQEETHNLGEVRVEASRTISKDGSLIIIPNTSELTTSTNGYTLLRKLALPRLRVDAVKHTISALDNDGTVQIRINNIVASTQEMLSLNPKTIISIEFIDKPGMRYGDGVSCVVNLKTKLFDNRGYTVGTDMSHATTCLMGNDEVFATFNSKKSEIGIDYMYGYQDLYGTRFETNANYLLSDDNEYNVMRKDVARRSRYYGNHIQAKWNIADSTAYVFQAKAYCDFGKNPGGYAKTLFNDGKKTITSTSKKSMRDTSPAFDLYYFRQLGMHQSITSNVVGTFIGSETFNFDDEKTNYEYSVSGKTWSLIGEVIYENRLKPFTITVGLEHKTKYTANEYTGNTSAITNMTTNMTTVYGELKGKWRNLNYTIEIGTANAKYRQEYNSYDFWTFRPKMSLMYDISPELSIGYGIKLDQHVSMVAMISDALIRKNSMEWEQGNPKLSPNRLTRHMLDINYSHKRLVNNVIAELRMNHKPNMEQYSRTNDNMFVRTQINQRSIDMWFIHDNFKYDIIKEHLSLQANIGLYHFINRGNDYYHRLTSIAYGGSLQTYIGRWTIELNGDNGWKFMEGETQSKQGASVQLSCGYVIGNITASIIWQNPLQNTHEENHVRLLDSIINKDIKIRDTDSGNMIMLNFAWRMSYGKKYKNINRSIENKDKETGIM